MLDLWCQLASFSAKDSPLPLTVWQMISDGRSRSRGTLRNIRKMAALHKRLALTEMTKHEFLDDKFRKERTTFSDGTTVTVDWDANRCEIQPDLP